MNRTEALDSLREFLKERGISAMIVPTNDPHFGEYTQDHYKVREWLSGFTGSAGTLVVTETDAALWTDSRYFVQAARELSGSGICLMKMKMEGTPSIAGWIREQYPSGARVGIDGALFSYADYLQLEKDLAPLTVESIPDPFDRIWKDRPPLAFRPVTVLPQEYSGESAASKFERVKQALCMGDRRFVYIVTACDEVAWLCNIRGTDIEYNPLPQSYAVITNQAVHLFADLQALDEETQRYLRSQGIEIHPYDSFTERLGEFPADTLRVCSAARITVRDYNALNIQGAVFTDDPLAGGTVARLKAIKNECEAEGFRKAFLTDGIAWCKLLKYIDDSLREGRELDEYALGEKLVAFRKECPLYRGESFEPIVAFGPAAALPHYSATETSSQKIGTDNFLLMDTGGHYLFGTTDTTRTVPVGKLTEEQKINYTLVLKGMISLSMAAFPKGTRGASLDVLARGPLYTRGLMYFHGTGHGIGHYLCVHEGPQSIRMEENPVPLEPGMVLSNEPAVYIEGKYGIRTENVLMVREWKTTPVNEFYRFETLTLVPIATECIAKEILAEEEIVWLNGYNAQVYEKISPFLDPEEKQWLGKACRPCLI